MRPVQPARLAERPEYDMAVGLSCCLGCRRTLWYGNLGQHMLRHELDRDGRSPIWFLKARPRDNGSANRRQRRRKGRRDGREGSRRGR